MELYSLYKDTEGGVESMSGPFRLSPLNAVDLGVLPSAKRECPRLEQRWVVVLFDGPGNHDLPGAHHRLAEWCPRYGRSGPPGLLFEFTGSGCLVIFALLDESFQQRPRSLVAACEERTARMGNKDLEAAAHAVGEKTRGSHEMRHYAGRVTALATYSPTDPGLAPIDSRLQLGRCETLGMGIKRVTMDQLEFAAAGYFEGESKFGRAIHQSRKAIKRVRSLLRLVRGELGERVFGYEDKSLRDTGRTISEIRSAAAIVGTAELVSGLYGDLLAEGTFEEMLVRLGQRRDVLELQALEDPNLAGRVVQGLERAYHRYSGWPTEPDARKIYGVGIRDDFTAIRPGLHATYGRGRKEMVSAYARPSPRNFHLWRKRAKYLRYQMEFLVPLWPEVITGMAVTLDRLGMILGEDHDLAELVDLIHSRPDLCPDPRERSLFTALAQQRRSELHVAAEILGRRVYAEKPGSLQARFGEYWDARQVAISRPLDTLVVY